jgi:large subunit ribosomal protein L22
MKNVVTAKLSHARIGAQKARIVADLVRGKNVDIAIRSLAFSDKKAAVIIKKLIESAVANAENKKTFVVDRLYVHTLMVNEGPSMKRFRPRAQGRAYGVKKKTSHIQVVLAER